MVRRQLAVTIALTAAALLVLSGAMVPAAANPGATPGANPDGTGQSVSDRLAAAVRAYNDAKGRLDASHARQGELERGLQSAAQRLTELDGEVGTVAAAAYRGSRMTVSMALLDSGSPAGLLHDAATVQYLASRDDREIHNLLQAKTDYTRQKTALDGEVKLQEQQLAEMDKRKNEAEKALGSPKATGGIAAGRPSATPAPRNKDGSYPNETCSVKDPTTSGCLTPRTLHALEQARTRFNHFTACFRSGGGGEHPLGRACDFAANPGGFVNARATGADKAYGDELARYLITNADQLAVLYVIWYKQIWTPGLGWRAYTSGDGTPAGDHYNHVHLSVH